MPIPNLKHPVPINIESVDQGETIYDDNHREPVQQSVVTQINSVPGQIKWFKEEMEIDTGGRKVLATGYVLFRYVDLASHSLNLKFNCRFTKLGNESALVFVVGLTPIAHYPDQGGATMVKAFFNDRQPAKGGFNY
jgi:hypothetical protein